MVDEEMTSPRAGDLARRIRCRREELDLSRAEVAQRAGMSPAYLAYVEKNADDEMSTITQLRLSKALGLTVQSLAGGDVARPPGPGEAGPDPVLETLTRQQCETYLQAGGIGRVVFVTGRGPTSFPVNFASVDGHVVFRTDANTAADIAASGTVGFEVDQIDEAMSEGWSVLVTGPAHVVEDPARLAQLERLPMAPWAGGDRTIFVRITPDESSGRAIHQSHAPAVAPETIKGSFGPTPAGTTAAL